MTELGLADLMRVWKAYGEDTDRLIELIRLFELGPARRATDRPPVSATLSATLDSTQVVAKGVLGPATPVLPADPAVDGGVVSAIRLVKLPPEPPSFPPWAAAPELDAPSTRWERPAIPLLFATRRARALLAEVARVPRQTGAIDVEAAVELLARRQPLAPIPRRSVGSLLGGAQLVIDRSQWMDPFAADRDDVVARMIAIVGPMLKQHVWSGDPGRERPWRPLHAGVPIIALTDFGQAAERIGRPAAMWRWSELVRVAKRHGNPVTIVKPGRSWPPRATVLRHVHLVPWDHRTRIGAWRRATMRSLVPTPSGAHRLAVMCSAAARLDATVIRRLRLALCPDLDAEAESALWFADFVQARTSAGLAIAPKQLDELRSELVASGKCDEVLTILDGILRGAPPLLELEHRLNALGLCGARTDAINDCLAVAVSTLRAGRQRLDDVAGWALRALPRLPRTVRESTAAWALSFAAEARTGFSITLGATPYGELGELALGVSLDTPTDSIGVRRGAGWIELGAVRGPNISVPATTPRIVEIEAGHVRKLVAISPGKTTHTEVLDGDVVLRTLRGDRWRAVADPAIVAPELRDRHRRTALPVALELRDRYRRTALLDKRVLRVVHLSDLHGRGVDGPQGERARREAPFRYRVTRTEWDRNLATVQEDGRPVDLVVFTGDLGDRGHTTDYAMGVELLKRTCAALKVPRERLFVVPGNHDIARRTEEEAWKAVREGLGREPLKGSNWMAGGDPPVAFDDRWRDAVLQRAGAFWSAVTVDLERPELGPWLHPHRRLGYQVKVQLDGLDAPLWIVGLDTAWLAGDDADPGSLRLTEHQVELLASNAGADLPGFRLALMHHRFADLADGERVRRLMADRVDLVLHGHQHEPAVEPWASPDHDLLVLAAGCLYEGDEGHRYPNAYQVIDLELTGDGRPERAAIRFRGWAERNGLFWGDDSLLYRSAKGGRLALRRHARGWVVDDAPAVRPWQPTTSEVFVGRADELAAIERAISAAPGARVAVVAVQGMAGVGKSFLVEEFCAQHGARFGVMCRWVLDPMKLERADTGLLEIAQQAGLDRDRTPVAMIPALLAERRAFVHVDNVDNREAAAVVVELLERLAGIPAIVTGRYTALGTTPGAHWVRVEVECLDPQRSIALLCAELGGDASENPELRELAVELGGLPLALHLAAGYLRGGASVSRFLESLRASGLGLPPADPADPLRRTRGRGVISAAFQISKELLIAEASRRGEPWAVALSALGWSALSGFGLDLGMAMTGLSRGSFEDFIVVATALSLVRRVPRNLRPDGAWSVHPLLAEFLRADVPRGEVDVRVREWVVAYGASGAEGAQGTRWATLSRESAAVHSWLASVDEMTLSYVLPRCWPYAGSHGPCGPWLAAARRACDRLREGRGPLAWAWAQLSMRIGAHEEVLRAALILETDGDGERDVAQSAGLRADILEARGELDEALRIRRVEQLPVYERLGDVRSKAVTMAKIADILQDRGELDEALRIRRVEQLPVYERLGDVREKAVTMGQIADILQDRGELDEALRIRREDELLVYERLGDVRGKAVTMGKIADILQARGELDEALRIRREDELPVYERVGDVRSKAVTMGQIADILQARGELDEALRIRREDELPVYEPLGDVRSKAVTMGKIADILKARGELDEALRIRRVEQLPVYERLGDVRSKAVTMGKIADILQARGELDEALRIRREDELPVYERLGDVRSKAVTMGKIADILEARGELDEALRIRREDELPVYERLGDVRSKAVTMGKIADILQARGELDEALRLRHVEQLPVYERLGDVRAKAVTMGKIANILQDRGELDEALRIRREDELPVYERLGDVWAKAVTMGKIADILQARGELDEALRIRRVEQLSVYERLGDVRSKAVTMGQIANILQARGELDEALRIRCEDELPVYERLGDVRSKAVTMGKIADILQARGDVDEALRILHVEQLPVFERQGGRELLVALANIGILLIKRGGPEDLVEARAHIERAAGMATSMRIPFPELLVQWLASSAGRMSP